MTSLAEAVLSVILVAFMAIEARRAALNERAQRERGGIEPAGDVYNLMRIAYPLAFGAMFVEGMAREWPAPTVVAAGAAIFAVAKALKWWAIMTLGPRWTFRVIVVPGVALVRRGPYRFFRHPNYVGVVGELVGTAVVTGASVAGPVATVLFGALILKRIAVEERALGV